MTGEQWLLFLTVYLVLSAAVAWFASTKGHRPGGWLLMALVLTPVVAFVIAVLSGPAQAREAMVCSRCRKPQSPYWTTKCNHCGALYSEHAPVAKT